MNLLTKEEVQNSVINIWKYLSVNNEEKESEVAFVLGRDDFSIPQKVVEMYNKKLVHKICILGGRGRLTGDIKGSESEAFKKYLVSKNIPEEVMYMEENSTNTGENIIEGLRLLHDNNLSPTRISLFTHAPHTRRALAVARAQNGSIKWIPCPDDCELPQDSSLTFRKELEELVGELDRLEKYSELGFFEDQHFPEDIMSSKKIIEIFLRAN